jgi:ribosomal protein L11 methyltransferase
MWIEVQIEVAFEAAELIADAVGGITGGVEVRDSGTLIQAGVNRAVVVALCAPERMGELTAELEAVCERARAAELPIDPVEVRRREAHEDEWRDVWKQYFRATRVGRSFIVRPSWDPGAVVDGDRVIDLDPGRAFGTGGHASTRLVIELAESVAGAVNSFLDLGCGSGILAIAAARLWPGAAGTAVDNDPEATACAQENLDRNRVEHVKVITGTLAEVAGTFDLILANIQADVLLELGEALAARLTGGGRLILSGLLTSDAPAVSQRYQALGLRLDASLGEDEWTALRFAGPIPDPATRVG